MDEIKYTTPSEQIEKLKSQNMIIHNEIHLSKNVVNNKNRPVLAHQTV